MQKIRKGFLLIESMTALWLAVLIISTLTLTVFVQYQQLKQLETRVTAHKLIWERLRDDSAPTKTTFSNHTYQTIADKNSVKVIGDAGKTYQVTWR
ncbi:hypothetical protein [Companilactobacillus zhongbaensis]|uniref:hypothetical protein n=1 Tax=Companilactobacillus zhongbaensis TaxID=2486009 RepID=UPI000F779AF3|nr:hypothetical protein [Companilactobacillus zhongbaensis]